MGSCHYGPLSDVPNVVAAGSQPYSDESVCAGCHIPTAIASSDGGLDSEKWLNGVDIQTTYSEWEDGLIIKRKHNVNLAKMPANTELNALDVTKEEPSITFGPREPEDVRKHLFRGPF